MSGVSSTSNAEAIAKAQAAAKEAMDKDLVLESLLYSFMGSVAAQDGVLQDYMDEMDKQAETLALINDFMRILDDIKARRLNDSQTLWNGSIKTGADVPLRSHAELVSYIASLVGGGIISESDLGDLSVEKVEALQAKLSTAQTTYGSLNEELSLKMNQAASSRTAMLTQLQTLLQTIMQARQQLARF